MVADIDLITWFLHASYYVWHVIILGFCCIRDLFLVSPLLFVAPFCQVTANQQTCSWSQMGSICRFVSTQVCSDFRPMFVVRFSTCLYFRKNCVLVISFLLLCIYLIMRPDCKQPESVPHKFGVALQHMMHRTSFRCLERHKHLSCMVLTTHRLFFSSAELLSEQLCSKFIKFLYLSVSTSHKNRLFIKAPPL